MNKKDKITHRVKKFHHEIIELIKKYQFRDRNQVMCAGISVSQCYTLEILHRFGPLKMNQLSDRMCLTISTMTRIIDQLVKKRLVLRDEDAKDRRIRLIRLTEEGKKVYQSAWKNTFQSEKAILESFSEEHREVLINFLKRLNQAFPQNRKCENR